MKISYIQQYQKIPQFHKYNELKRIIQTICTIDILNAKIKVIRFLHLGQTKKL